MNWITFVIFFFASSSYWDVNLLAVILCVFHRHHTDYNTRTIAWKRISSTRLLWRKKNYLDISRQKYISFKPKRNIEMIKFHIVDWCGFICWNIYEHAYTFTTCVYITAESTFFSSLLSISCCCVCSHIYMPPCDHWSRTIKYHNTHSPTISYGFIFIK